MIRLYVLCVLSSISIVLLKKRDDCFALAVLRLSLSLPLPHGAAGWPAVCDCSHTRLLFDCQLITTMN